MVSVMLYPCMFCVALSMDPPVLCAACPTVVMNCLVKQLAICLGVFAILLLNVMGVVGGWRLEIISSFRSLRTGSHVSALLMLFLCVTLHNMSSGKNQQLPCIFSPGMLCLSATNMMPVKILLAVCILVGMVF